MPGSVYYKKAIKNIIQSILPLNIRKHLAVWVNRQKWMSSSRRSWWSQELIRDLAVKDINEYHKFLWSNHLAYAATYEVTSKFGHNNMKQSRQMFFLDLKDNLVKLGFDPNRDIKSVFEVGCSLGYQLRYMETDLFRLSTELKGIDIDRTAIASGSDYLKGLNSRVMLICADMEELHEVMGNRMYDLIICTGALMYLNEVAAARVVDTMLKYTRIMLAFTGLAHPEIDNSLLQHSLIRNSDGSFIHNIDSMVTKAGGEVLVRKWEGSKMVDGHTIYFVFASKPTRV